MRLQDFEPVQGPGLCKCGCGAPCPIANTTDRRCNVVKGQPWNYLKGHSHRVRPQGIRAAFEEHLYPDPNSGCFLFVGKSAGGQFDYGFFRLGKRRVLAHRVAWVLEHGCLDDDTCVLHKCDTPACCNPDHLFLGSRADNCEDRARKDRGRRGRWPRGVSRLPSGKFRAQACVPKTGKTRMLGDFDAVEDAAAAARAERGQLGWRTSE